jgi:hypothetical protein
MSGKLTKQLLEVINISSELIDLKPEDFEILKSERETLSKWGEEIVKTFYDKLSSAEETSKILEKFPRKSLEKTLLNWYLSILDGTPDNEFWQKQWFVALAHIARKVDNYFMLSSMSLLQETFGDLCFKYYEPKRAWEIFKAFKRITDTISAVIVEGYLVLYKVALEGLSGMKPALVDRMVLLEAQKMWQNYKQTRG